MSGNESPPTGLAALLKEARIRKRHAKQILAAADAYVAYSTCKQTLERKEKRAALDQQLDGLDEVPEAWNEMKVLVGDEKDGALAGLMRYSLTRSREQMRALQQEVEKMPEWHVPTPAPPKIKTQGRSKSRDRSR
jgi:hypothetical protein